MQRMCRAVLDAKDEFNESLVKEVEQISLIASPQETPLDQHDKLKEAVQCVGQSGTLGHVLGQFPLHGRGLLQKANEVLASQGMQLEWHEVLRNNVKALATFDATQSSAVDTFCDAVRTNHTGPEGYRESFKATFAKEENGIRMVEFKVGNSWVCDWFLPHPDTVAHPRASFEGCGDSYAAHLPFLVGYVIRLSWRQRGSAHPRPCFRADEEAGVLDEPSCGRRLEDLLRQGHEAHVLVVFAVPGRDWVVSSGGRDVVQQRYGY